MGVAVILGKLLLLRTPFICIVTSRAINSYTFFRKESFLKSDAIVAAILTKVKDVLQNHAEIFNNPLTAEHVERVIQLLKTTFQVGCAEGLKTYLQENEIKKILSS
jgi:hypothetical protein